MGNFYNYLHRAFYPKTALNDFLVRCLALPPSDREFLSNSGYCELRGTYHIFAELKRCLGYNSQVDLDGLITTAGAKPHKIRPELITCGSRPDIRNWDDFCRSEAESNERDHGCRNRSEYDAIYCKLTTGLKKVEPRRVYQWGNDFIWANDGHHRIAAMAHFSKNNPHEAWAIEVSMHEFKINRNHPLSKASFGVIREQEAPETPFYELRTLFPQLSGAVEYHHLTRNVYGSKPMFDRCYLLIVRDSNQLSGSMLQSLREHGLYWDLKMTFGGPQ